MNIIRIIIQLHVEHQNGSKPFNNEFPRYYTATSLRYTEHFFVTLGFSFCSTKKKKKKCYSLLGVVGMFFSKCSYSIAATFLVVEK